MYDPSAISVFIVLLVAPFAILPAAYFLWLRHVNRPPEAGQAIVPLYEPPSGIGPAEAGLLMERALHPRAVAALVVDLHLRGLIEMNEIGGRVENLRRLPAADDAVLAPYERFLLDRLFERSSVIDIKAAGADLAACRLPLQALMRRRLREKGLMADRRLVAMMILVAAVIAALMLGLIIGFGFGPVAGIAVAAVLVFMGQLCYFALIQPALSEKGRQAISDIYGFRMYLGAVEGDRIKWEEKEKNISRFTPFAVVFDISVTWSNKLQVLTKALLENIL